jgi:hypothetical protein
MVEQRFAAHLNQSLGFVVGIRTQPSTETGCKNHGFHGVLDCLCGKKIDSAIFHPFAHQGIAFF